MIKLRSAFIIFYIFINFQYILPALDFYVDAAAAAGGNGSSTQPFRSLLEARDALRALTSGGMTEDIIVYLDGTFFLDAPLLFNTSDGGKDGYNIIYRGDGEPAPLISGGRSVTTWYSAGGYIYWSDVGPGTFTALYENGRAAAYRGNRAALDMPGTFTQTGTIIYYYPFNTPVDDQEIILPVTTSLIRLEGDSVASPLVRLGFEGIVFSGTAFDDTVSGAPGDEQALFCMRNTENVRLRYCRLLNAGNTAVLMDKHAQSNVIEYNRIDGFGEQGLSLSGLTPGDVGFNVPTLASVNRENIIHNNLLTSGGHRRDGGAALRLYQSVANVITHNTIMGIKGSGIMLTGLPAFPVTHDNRIENNRIYDLEADSASAAGVYAGAAGFNRVEQNLIYRLRNSGTGNSLAGIYLDSAARGIEVRGNAVYDVIDFPGIASGLKLAGNDLVIDNNIIADNEPFRDLLWENGGGGLDGVRLTHNIFYTPQGSYYHYFTSQNLPLSLSITNNLVYHPGGELFVALSSSRQLDFNQWRYFSKEDAGTITGMNPLFTYPEAGGYRLDTSSPARWFNNLDFQSPGLNQDFPFRYATDRIEAEKYNAVSDNRLNAQSLIRATGNGSWVRYSDLHFTSDRTRFLIIRYAVDTLEGSFSGLEFELELRQEGLTRYSPNSFRLPGTGSLDNYKQFAMELVNLPTGIYDVYYRFSGDTTRDVLLDWFGFSDTAQVGTLPEAQTPYLEVLSPSEGSSFIFDDPINVEAWATDADGVVERIDLFVDEVLWFTENSDRLERTVSGLALGNHTLRFVAVDNQGLTASRSIVINIDNEASRRPVVEILEPEDGDVISGVANPNVNVRAAVSSGASAIDRVECLFDNMPRFSRDQLSEYSFNWTNVQPGEHTIRVVAYNTAGFQAEESITIIVDNSAHILGHWPLDETGGTIARDSSPYQHDGIITNAYGSRGIIGGALDFPGNASVVTGIPIMSHLPQFTMAGWVCPRSFGGRAGLWGQDNVMEFGFIGKGVLHLWTANGGSCDASYPYPAGEWHHIAVTGDGQNLKLYLDGALSEIVSHSTSNYGGDMSSSFNIGGGGIFDESGNYFNGLIDNVIVYRRAVTGFEISRLASYDGNLPPSIQINYPGNGTRLDGPTSVHIQVTAADQDSGIREVEYSINGEFLGNNTQPPYDYMWRGVPPGTYILKAEVIDNDGRATVDEVNFTVQLMDEDLLAYWSFDDYSDTTVYDLSPNENHGSVTNGTAVDGYSNGALAFRGNGAMVSSRGMLNSLKAFTIAGWIKPESTGSRAGLWGQDGVVEFGFPSDGEILLWAGNAGAVSVAYPFPVQEWHHVAAVGNGQSLMIYCDGKLVVEEGRRSYFYGSTNRTFNLAGGGIFDASGNYFSGVIDEVYVYSRALSGEELLELANASAYLVPEVRFTNLSDGDTLEYPFSLQVKAEVLRTEDCAATAVEFFINNQSVHKAEEPPYQFLWEIPEDPGVESFELLARLTTACGVSDDASLTVLVREGSGENPEDEEPDDGDVYPGGGEYGEGANPASPDLYDESSFFDFTRFSSGSRGNFSGRNSSYPQGTDSRSSGRPGTGTVLREETGGSSRGGVSSPQTGNSGSRPPRFTLLSGGKGGVGTRSSGLTGGMGGSVSSHEHPAGSRRTPVPGSIESGKADERSGENGELITVSNPEGNTLGFVLPLLVLLLGAGASLAVWVNRRKREMTR